MSSRTDGYGLDGRVCVATGGGSGIGRGIAVALAAEGARVAILDKNEAGANETLAMLDGGTGIALACDVTHRSSIEAPAGTIAARFGEVDVLVNNAGMIRAGALADLPIED